MQKRRASLLLFSLTSIKTSISSTDEVIESLYTGSCTVEVLTFDKLRGCLRHSG